MACVQADALRPHCGHSALMSATAPASAAPLTLPADLLHVQHEPSYSFLDCHGTHLASQPSKHPGPHICSTYCMQSLRWYYHSASSCISTTTTQRQPGDTCLHRPSPAGPTSRNSYVYGQLVGASSPPPPRCTGVPQWGVARSAAWAWCLQRVVCT
jgi:hypothetical protein